LSILLSTSCVSLRPLDEAIQSPLTGRHLSIDNHRIYVEEMGDGEPVLLVHGLGGSTYSWRKIQPELASRYRTAAVDLLGFGYSERPRDRHSYGRVEQVELLAEVVNALGWRSAHVVGHSYGGGLVMTLAYRYPQRVRSLILIASTAPDYAEQRRHLLGRRWFASIFLRGFALRPGFVRRTLERSFFDDATIDEPLVTEYLRRLRIEGVTNAYVGLTAPRSPPGPEWQVELEEIRQPSLVLWGENDSLIDIEGARRESARIPRSHFVAIPECGHIPIEEKPEVVLREILRFLAGLGA
jgi:pimeloyl-ACP methyl ester carboxylesterase